MSAEEVKAAPEGTTVPLKGGATEYAVYVHRWDTAEAWVHVAAHELAVCAGDVMALARAHGVCRGAWHHVFYGHAPLPHEPMLHLPHLQLPGLWPDGGPRQGHLSQQRHSGPPLLCQGALALGCRSRMLNSEGLLQGKCPNPHEPVPTQCCMTKELRLKLHSGPSHCRAPRQCTSTGARTTPSPPRPPTQTSSSARL